MEHGGQKEEEKKEKNSVSGFKIRVRGVVKNYYYLAPLHLQLLLHPLPPPLPLPLPPPLPLSPLPLLLHILPHLILPLLLHPHLLLQLDSAF